MNKSLVKIFSSITILTLMLMALPMQSASAAGDFNAPAVYLSGFGGIDHVVNDTGAAVNSTNQVANIVNFP